MEERCTKCAPQLLFVRNQHLKQFYNKKNVRFRQLMNTPRDFFHPPIDYKGIRGFGQMNLTIEFSLAKFPKFSLSECLLVLVGFLPKNILRAAEHIAYYINLKSNQIDLMKAYRIILLNTGRLNITL